MSLKQVKEILDRASKDKKFREELLKDPKEALKDYQLPDKVRAKFLNISEKKLVAFKNNMDHRIAKDGSSALTNANSEDDFWVESVTD